MQQASNKATAPEVEIPTIVLQINGGVIKTVTANFPARVIILDEDIEGADAEAVKTVQGEEVYVSDFNLVETPSESEADKKLIQAIIADLEQ